MWERSNKDCCSTLTKLFRHITCVLFLLNAISAGAYPFDGRYSPFGTHQPSEFNQNYPEYRGMMSPQDSEDKEHKGLFDGQIYTSANDIFGGVTTIDHEDMSAINPTPQSHGTSAPPNEGPVGDAVVPLMLMVLAYGVWKRRRVDN